MAQTYSPEKVNYCEN